MNLLTPEAPHYLRRLHNRKRLLRIHLQQSLGPISSGDVEYTMRPDGSFILALGSRRYHTFLSSNPAMNARCQRILGVLRNWISATE